MKQKLRKSYKSVKIKNIGKFIKFERSSTIWFGKIKLEMIVQVKKRPIIKTCISFGKKKN
jgi:hypothetical protein